MWCRFVNKLNYHVRPFPCIHIFTAAQTLIYIRLLSFSFLYYVTYHMKTMYILFHPSRHFSQDLWSHLLCLGFSPVSGISFISPLCSLYHSFCFRYAQNTQHSSQNTIMLVIMIIPSRWDVEGKTSLFSEAPHICIIFSLPCDLLSLYAIIVIGVPFPFTSLAYFLTNSTLLRARLWKRVWPGIYHSSIPVCGFFRFQPNLVWNILKYLEM